MSDAPGAAAELTDAEERRRIREDLDATLLVEAAAGTGKTSALVARVVALLRSGGARLEHLVAVTFTEKAAGEMKLRLRAGIEAARAGEGLSSAERGHLEQALEQLELARIGTIHAFCADLLRERPIEAGVDPLFAVAPEDEAERLLDEAFASWFERTLAAPPEGVRRVLRRRGGGRDAQGPREQLRNAVGRLVEHRDFPAPWRRAPFDRRREIDRVLEELAALGALARRAEHPEDDWLAKNLLEIERFVAENAVYEAVRGRDHDALEASLRALVRARSWRWRDRPSKRFAKELTRAEVVARRDRVKGELAALMSKLDADLAACLREELRPVVEAYEVQKLRAGRLDFLDLLLRARNLVRDQRAVREELQRRFSHFFVDEFQDTDPLQAELLLLLAADAPAESDWRRVTPVPGKLFVVGDPKQSIYRFRRADVAIYEAVKRQLAAGGAEVLRLGTSFRSLPSLQSAVNAAFAPLMQGSADGRQAEYVPLQPFRSESGARPALIALPVPRPYGDYGRVVHWKLEESLPDAVGAFVDWLVHRSGWSVEEPGRGAVPLAPRHVCLLFRRFRSWRSDVTRPYVRALEARRVPHVLVGGRSFHEREELLAIRNALAAIEWPDDELRVFASLRGPLFALGDDALLAWRERVGRFHTLRRLAPEALAVLDPPEREVADALALLGGLHAGRNHRPAAETLTRLLDGVRAHAGIAIWPTGEQALANCLRSVDLARRFERGGASSFRAFVEHMEAEAERGEAQDAPVVEEGTEGVRIMTVHRAKGLEFPVVVLADPTAKRVGGQPSRHVDPARGLWAEPLCGCAAQDLLDAAEDELGRDAEESVRLAYVAATRARDLLVVPVLGDEEISGWIDVLGPAVHPLPANRRDAQPAPGCPAFGADSVLERPERCTRGAAASVRPGRHRARAGSHDVVWWDPALLELERSEELGLRQQRLLEADEGGVAAAEGERAHAAWQAQRAAALAAGARPSLAVASVTSLAALADAQSRAGAEPVRVEEVPLERGGRPAGRRFGTLVHALLAAVDLDADAAAVAAESRLQGRLLGADEQEIAAAAAAAAAALGHPLLRRAAAAARRGALRRETPLQLRLADGSLAEGVVDLAFREQGEAEGARWTVVDFKTQRELGAQRAQYEAQLRLYMAAIRASTGEPGTGVLLLV